MRRLATWSLLAACVTFSCDSTPSRDGSHDGGLDRGPDSSTDGSPVVDGQCGSADGVATTTAPTSGLCSAGTASAVSGTGPWTWTCAGANGGSTASCSAPVASSTVQKPGPSPALFAAPFYTCVKNFYVATNGNDSAAGDAAHPWKTIANADSAQRQAGDCINVAPGTYAAGVEISHGGNAATATGYVVYRCQTLNGCIITDGSLGFGITGAPAAAAYVVIDGFELAGPSTAAAQSTYGQGIKVWDGGGDDDFASHHVWVLNNIIHGYGQSGVQINDGEYYYVIHNTIYNNSLATCDAQGSGVSMGFYKAKAGYTPTADDDASPSPLIGTLTPYRNVTSWNVIYNNHISNQRCPGNYHTDGNGIIMDRWDNDWNSYGQYAGKTLVAFNVVYNNGGMGIHQFNAFHVTVANNSVYNNTLDTENTGTYRPGIGFCCGGSQDNEYINNLSSAILGSGILADNEAFSLDGAPPGPGAVVSNIALGPVEVYNGATFSCTDNKCDTDPLWVDVGTVAPGDMDTPPNGHNFALQAGSPAIGYGVTKPYLSPQSVDAGACHHTLTTCP